MKWFGLFIGIGLGVVFGSVPVGIGMALVGFMIGLLIVQNRKTAGVASNKSPALQVQVALLQTQVRLLTDRLGALELLISRTDAPPLAGTTEAKSAQVLVPTPATPAPAVMVTSSPTSIPALQPVPVVPAAIATPTASATQRPASVPAAAAAPARIARPLRPPAEPGALQIFFRRWVIGGNPLVKIGVLILFLGLAFLLRYAAEHAVLPVEVRYAAVAVAGIALLLFGWRWRLKKDNYGLILQGSGIAVLYLTTLAAMRLHPLIPLEFGFAILIAVAAFAALLAVLQDSLALALVASIGGFAAPILSSNGSGNHVALFSYLTLLNLGIVVIAWFKAWRPLNLVGFGCTVMLSGAWAIKYYQPALFGTTEPFLLLLFGLYVLVTFLFARRTLAQANGGFADQLAQIGYVDGMLVFGVPTATFAMQLLLAKPWEYGAAFSALGYGLFYIVLAFLLFRGAAARYRLLSETMVALGVVFGSLAIPLGLDARLTSAAWAVEAAGVFWIGVRQDRMHARWFALLLLMGSAGYFALTLQVGNASVAIDGAPLGAVLIALASALVTRLMRVASEVLSPFERSLQPWILAGAAAFAGLLPFLLLSFGWASPALAIEGSLLLLVAQRLKARALLFQSLGYQALAGVLFVTTLHSGAAGSVLGNGWSGLVAAALIGGSMLAGVWAMTRQGDAGTAGERRIKFTPAANIGMLAGLMFFNLAPLFVLPWRVALLIWPVTGLLTLWWAVRARHVPSLLFGLGLQAVAGLAFFGTTFLIDSGNPAPARAFANLNFVAPLLIALAAFFCARLLQRGSVALAERLMGWIALVWAGGWWALAWCSELARVLAPFHLPPVLAGVVVTSVVSVALLARRWHWTELGQATLIMLPALTLVAAWQWAVPGTHPFTGWGMLVWPMVLLAHFWLLRRQADWVGNGLLGLAHTLGAWLFVTVAALELRWQFSLLGDPYTAWALLGWMIAPVAFIWTVTRSSVQQRWPLRDFSNAYLRDACIPILAYLIGWIWVSNAVSDGSAAPLPYLPLLNPLELAQCAALLGIVSWMSLRRLAGYTANAVVGASAFAMLTGMVARSCHHWGHVPWQIDALLASNLLQTALSITWSVVAIGLMLIGNRRAQRWIWIVGALLMAVVVAKLFLVELAATGSLARIVSFIVVGVLLLVVGYFAPLPPKPTAKPVLEGA